MAQRLKSNNLKLFNRNTFPLFTFFVLFLACLILMGFDYRYGLLKKIKSEFSLATSPINYIINLPVEMYHNTKNIFKTVKLLTKENQILEKKLKKINYSNQKIAN